MQASINSNRIQIYAEGKSHHSRMMLDSRGNIIRRRSLSSYAREDQRGAIHEAGHAVAAWALNRRVTEIAYESFVWVACGMIVLDDLFGYVQRDDFLAFDEAGDADVDDVIEECAISYAGCVAEARYAHVALPYCMNSSGGGDIARIRECLRKGECLIGEGEQEEALKMARRICAKYRDLIHAIAEILLARSRLDGADFLEILGKCGYSKAMDEDEGRWRRLKEDKKSVVWEMELASSGT